MPISYIEEFRSLIPNTQELRANLISNRLLHVYRFAGEIIGYSENHFDAGTYNGFAIKELRKFAKKIATCDIDFEKLQEAKNNPDVDEFIKSGSVSLLHMDARNISLESDYFDSATCVEVFGAGFEGEETEVVSVFTGIHRVLKPGGIFIFTIKSKTNENLMRPINWKFPKGYPMHRTPLEKEILNPLFGHVDWYGHMTVLINERGNMEIPGHSVKVDGEEIFVLDESIFVPQPIPDPSKERPMYWVGVCRKPF